MTTPPSRPIAYSVGSTVTSDAVTTDPLCQCQGCGAWASIKRLGDPHNCHRNEDGTYEEGGTFQ